MLKIRKLRWGWELGEVEMEERREDGGERRGVREESVDKEQRLCTYLPTMGVYAIWNA